VNGLEAVLVLAAGLAFLALLVWCSYSGDELARRRATARRERLRAEVELQRLTHLAVLQMLAAARKDYRPGQ
jgi:hypothetical protein